MKKVLIRGGLIVTPEAVRRGDILVQGDRISQVASEIQDTEAEIIDANGLHVLPGLIDAHVHLRDPGATQKEDFTSGTRAALKGGVTTVLDMPNNPRPTTTPVAFQDKLAVAKARSVCDFGLYLGATSENASTDLTEETGAVGLKVYLGSTTGDLLVTGFTPLYEIFSQKTQAPVVVHAEDNEALTSFGADAMRVRHSDRRPPLCASLAVARVLALAQSTGRPLHIAHISTADEVALVQDARARGIRVSYEITPHHLFLSTEDEARLGPFGMVNPPLRSPEDVRAMWAALRGCNMIATDHAPHTIAEKESGHLPLGSQLPRPPAGMPGLETLLPLLLTAVHDRRLVLAEVARLTSCGPARVFGLSTKGAIAPGKDADLVLVRLGEEYILGKPWETKCNWSPFEGFRARGKIACVFRRGELVVSEGQVLAEPGSGRHVRPILA